MDKETRKAELRGLLKATGYSFDTAVEVLKVPYGTFAAWMRHDLDNDTTVGPSDEILDRMRDIVVKKAQLILDDAWAEEAKRPLNEVEFKRAIAQQLDFKINYEEEFEHEPLDAYPCDIGGRTGLLGRVEFPVQGRKLSDVREEILEFTWDHYRTMSNRPTQERSPEQERQLAKEKLQDLKRGLGITAADLAAATDRSVASVNAWLHPNRDNVPPASVIGDLQSQMQQWAHKVIVAIASDRKRGRISKSPEPSLAKTADGDFVKIVIPKGGPGRLPGDAWHKPKSAVA